MPGESNRSQNSQFIVHIKKTHAFIAGVFAVLAGISQIPEINEHISDMISEVGTIELSGSYPKEKWRVAKEEDYSWLQDEWCYPSNNGLQSRFKVESGKLYRQQYGSSLSQPTHWIPMETVHISNRSTLRLKYPQSEEWPVDFIEFEKEQPYEIKEYTRGINDDGTVSSNQKFLMLSCKHCKVSQDGGIYNCDKKQ